MGGAARARAATTAAAVLWLACGTPPALGGAPRRGGGGGSSGMSAINETWLEPQFIASPEFDTIKDSPMYESMIESPEYKAVHADQGADDFPWWIIAIACILAFALLLYLTHMWCKRADDEDDDVYRSTAALARAGSGGAGSDNGYNMSDFGSGRKARAANLDYLAGLPGTDFGRTMHEAQSPDAPLSPRSPHPPGSAYGSAYGGSQAPRRAPGPHNTYITPGAFPTAVDADGQLAHHLPQPPASLMGQMGRNRRDGRPGPAPGKARVTKGGAPPGQPIPTEIPVLYA